MPLVLRVLGPANFGTWGAAVSLAWVVGLADIGTGAALVTLIARSTARETENHEARDYLGGALGLGSNLAIVLLAAAAIIVLIAVPQKNAGPYLIVVVGLALNIPVSTANNVWLALQKGHISSLWESLQTLLTLVGLLTAVMFKADLRVYIGVVYAALVLANLGSLMHLLLAHPDLRPRPDAVMSLTRMREVLRHGMMYFAMGIAGGLCFFLDNVLALKLLGPEASARMTIAMRICMTAVSMLVVLSQPLWPAFAEAAERRDEHWIRRGVLRGTTTLALFTLSCSVILIVFGERLLSWWLHTNLGFGRGLLVAIAGWIVAQALSRVPNLLLNGLSILRFQIIVYSFAAVVALGLKCTLPQRFGLSSILWSTTIPILTIVIPASTWRIRRWRQESSQRFSLAFGAEHTFVGSTFAISKLPNGHSAQANLPGELKEA